jgi:osmotically-inducible protein OsmY
MSVYDAIAKQIQESLMADERTQDASIEVTNDRGIVTLNGRVESETIASAAEDIAKNQSGVIKVVNSMRVGEEQESSMAAS